MVKRNLVLNIILTIVTCGLFGLYWFYCLHNDTNQASGEEGGFSAIAAILLTIVTCGIYGWVWMYQRGQLIEKAYRDRGRSESDKAILYLILAIVGLSIVSYALMQNDLNKIVDIDNGVA